MAYKRALPTRWRVASVLEGKQVPSSGHCCPRSRSSLPCGRVREQGDVSGQCGRRPCPSFLSAHACSLWTSETSLVKGNWDVWVSTEESGCQTLPHRSASAVSCCRLRGYGKWVQVRLAASVPSLLPTTHPSSLPAAHPQLSQDCYIIRPEEGVGCSASRCWLTQVAGTLS